MCVLLVHIHKIHKTVCKVIANQRVYICVYTNVTVKKIIAIFKMKMCNCRASLKYSPGRCHAFYIILWQLHLFIIFRQENACIFIFIFVFPKRKGYYYSACNHNHTIKLLIHIKFNSLFHLMYPWIINMQGISESFTPLLQYLL